MRKTHQLCQRHLPLDERGQRQKHSGHKDQRQQADPYQIVERQQEHVVRVRELRRPEYERRAGWRWHRNVLNRTGPVVGHKQSGGSDIGSIFDQFTDHAVPACGGLVLVAPRRHDAVANGGVHERNHEIGEHVVGLGDGVDVFVTRNRRVALFILWGFTQFGYILCCRFRTCNLPSDLSYRCWSSPCWPEARDRADFVADWRDHQRCADRWMNHLRGCQSIQISTVWLERYGILK